MNVGALARPGSSVGAPTPTAPAPRASDDKATVRPPFDPVEFARQSELSTMPPTGQGPDLDPVISTEATMEVLFVDGDTVPSLAVAREDLEWFDLAQPVRDLLRHVDGEATLATVCARAKRSVEDGVSLVEQLVRDGVLSSR